MFLKFVRLTLLCALLSPVPLCYGDEPNNNNNQQEGQKPGHEKNGLPEIIIGSSDAPNTVVMLFSPTCTHCSEYEQSEFPKIFEKYIKTNIIKFKPRVLPLNNIDTIVGLLMWSQGGENFFKNMIMFMQNQGAWLPFIFEKDAGKRREYFINMLGGLPSVLKPKEVLNALDIDQNNPKDEDYVKIFALMNGISIEEINISLNNEKLRENLFATHLEALDDNGQPINAVPSFYFNGTYFHGIATLEELDKLIAQNSKPKKSKATKPKGKKVQPSDRTIDAGTAVPVNG